MGCMLAGMLNNYDNSRTVPAIFKPIISMLKLLLNDYNALRSVVLTKNYVIQYLLKNIV